MKDLQAKRTVMSVTVSTMNKSVPFRLGAIGFTSLVFLLLCTVSATALQPPPFRAGKFTNQAITTLAKSLGGEMGGHLEWFADAAQLFTFPGHDGLPLQGYYIPAIAAADLGASDKSDVNGVEVSAIPLPGIPETL